MFKNKLQHQCQVLRFPLPVYETQSQGPSHMPLFKSCVKVNGFRFQSPSFFTCKKRAEDEVARLAFEHFDRSRKHKKKRTLETHAANPVPQQSPSSSANSAIDTTKKKASTVKAENLKEMKTVIAANGDADREENNEAIMAIVPKETPDDMDFHWPDEATPLNQKPKKTNSNSRDFCKEKPQQMNFNLANNKPEANNNLKDVQRGEDSEVDKALGEQMKNFQKIIQKHEEQDKEMFIQYGNQWRNAFESQRKDMEELLGSWKELITKIKTLESELNHKNFENNVLVSKDRKAVSEILEARNRAIQILANEEDSDGEIIVKRMGELDQRPWIEACKKKFRPCEWKTKYAELYSAWEDNLRDPSWHPFKVITIGDKFERIVDQNDKKLQQLLRKLGKAVYNSVIKALQELEEYNASGRYPVQELWNVKENRRATLKEVVDFFHQRRLI